MCTESSTARLELLMTELRLMQHLPESLSCVHTTMALSVSDAPCLNVITLCLSTHSSCHSACHHTLHVSSFCMSLHFACHLILHLDVHTCTGPEVSAREWGSSP